MGFDLYGLNPENPNKAVKPEQIDWSKKPTEKEKSAYFDAVDDFQIEVVGSYFRANVWYWRPIWSFVCGACNDILTENDMERGSFNDGHKISKTKAKRIAARLRKLDKSGIIQTWEDEMMVHINKARKHNEEIDLDLSIFMAEMKMNYGDDIVPAKLSKKHKAKWQEIYDKKKWDAHYPASREYIIEFSVFCDASGGFEIC